MMTHAYHETYLSKAQALLGEALDYAVRICGMDGEDFLQMLALSPLSRNLENGDPSWISGRSGIELTREVLGIDEKLTSDFSPSNLVARNEDYWIGWALAFYQWYSARRYREILQVLTYQECLALYPLLHEADITKFVDVAEYRLKEYFKDTKLKRIRTSYNCSQSELAKGSGVSLRSIQMYEQRNKDINKASAETVLKLAKFLGVTMEDLLGPQQAFPKTVLFSFHWMEFGIRIQLLG